MTSRPESRDGRRTASDDTVACRIKYIGTNDGGRIIVSGGYVHFLESTTLDSNVGSGGIVNTLTTGYDTVKDFVDYINNSTGGDWIAWPEDGLPTDMLSTYLADRATNASDNSNLIDKVGLPLKVDVSATKKLQFGVNWKNYANKAADSAVFTEKFVEAVQYELQPSSSTDIVIDILEADDKNDSVVTKQIHTIKSNNSATVINSTLDFGSGAVLVNENKRLVVRVRGFSKLSTGNTAHAINVTAKVLPPKTGGGYRAGNTKTPINFAS